MRSLEVTGSYLDVQMKAVRLRQEGKVKVIRIDPDIAAGEVVGDSGQTYEVVLYRQDPDSESVSLWECECLWSQYAWGPVRRGRMCSHALALLYEIQSRENRKDSPDYRWRKVEASSLHIGALIAEEDLPPRLRETIEEFRKMPNVCTLTDRSYAMGQCQNASYDFVQFARQRGHEAELRSLRQYPWDPAWEKDPELELQHYRGDRHDVAFVDGYYIDWTARQFDRSSPVPRIYQSLNDSMGFDLYIMLPEVPGDIYYRYMPGAREDMQRFDERTLRLKACSKHGGNCWITPYGHVPEDVCICPRGYGGDWEYPIGAVMAECPVHGDDDHAIDSKSDPRVLKSSSRQRYAMALLKEEDLPPRLRETIEAFRKMPNVDRLEDPEFAAGLCGTASYDFVQFARQRGHKAELRNLREDPWDPAWVRGEREFELYQGRCHQVAFVDGYYIDWTARQYDPDSPVPRIYQSLNPSDSAGFSQYFKQKDERPDTFSVRFIPDVREDVNPAQYENPPLVQCDEHGGLCWETPYGHLPEDACICPKGPVGPWERHITALMADCPVHGDDEHRVKQGDPRLLKSAGFGGYLQEPNQTLYPYVFAGLRVMPHVRDALREYILKPLSSRFENPDAWLHFYLYGSGASYNWDETGDLDVQVFVDEDLFWKTNPDADLRGDTLLSTVRKSFADLNFRTLEQMGLEGKMTVQYYAKPGSGSDEQVLSERPYAAYDLDEDRWVVEPTPMTPEFFASVFERAMPKAQMLAEHIATLQTAYDVDLMSAEYWGAMAERDPQYADDRDRYRAEAELGWQRLRDAFNSIRQGRQDAYSPNGLGNKDERDAVYKILSAWGILDSLKQRIEAGVPWKSGA